MEYVIHRGIKIPLIGFGSYRLGDNKEDLNNEITTYNYGIDNYKMTLIDTAEMYGSGKSEEVIGKIIKDKKREDLFIIDKILPENAILGQYEKSCRKSLELVGTNYFDLYLLHWKSTVNLQEMVYEMEKLVSLGLIKNWGVSNFDTFEMEELFKCDKGKNCFCNQILYNIGVRGPEYDLIPWCQKNDVLVMAYSPLYNNKEDRIKYTSSKLIQDIAKKEDKTPESLMLSFVVRNRDIVTIFKTSNIEHLNNNMKNVFETISADDLEVIDKKYPKPSKKERLMKI